MVSGPAGTPVVDFDTGHCTFCYACADACDSQVFALRQSAPWELRAVISDDCLLSGGVSCQSCTDACDDRALRFNFQLGIVGSIETDLGRCTGCGACVSVCPAGAISVSPPNAVVP